MHKKQKSPYLEDSALWLCLNVRRQMLAFIYETVGQDWKKDNRKKIARILGDREMVIFIRRHEKALVISLASFGGFVVRGSCWLIIDAHKLRYKKIQIL